MNSLDSMPPSELYNYLVDAIYKFKYSWCGGDLMDMEKTTFIRELPDGVNITAPTSKLPLFVTPKNSYNYYKCLVHTGSGDDFTRLPKRWKSLDSAQKLEFVNRFKKDRNEGQDAPQWFSIKKYIRTYIYEPNEQSYNSNMKRVINEINNDIYYFVNNGIVVDIFHTLITNGILSYFKASPEKEVDSSVFLQTNRNALWTHAYHYLTNRPFNKTGTYDFKMRNGIHRGNIFSHNMQNMESQWYARTSMHWIAQIGLCHKIIHQRIHFITGGTGIGKSSVVPILYMYYQKALDYNMAGSVVCTMPRVQPTQNTARDSAAQLGIPITIDNANYNEKNYNIQMAHQKKKHVDDGEYLKLKFCTDGSLLMDLKNPMLKQFTDKKRSRYTIHNMYDVVIVDEAHEHNANMDIILSIMKNIAHYNNTMKVVIMSATIDDDEPAYRRFYRNINDNRKYPLCKWIEQHNIDRVNVDRRLHIAVPGSDTRFNIDDIYVPGEIPEKFVCKIMSETQSGYGLLFMPGQAEISKSVKYINENTSSNIIALPYYAKLNDDAKEFVKDVDTKLSSLKIAKTDDLNEMGEEGRLSTGPGKYDRCVIVATNIAEASITIDKLTLVFETGQQKKQIYDYRVRSAVLKTEMITESSRLQRRGRVGRTAPGKSYYIYAKDTMKYNKFMFDISISDQTMNLLDILQDTYNEQPFVNIDVGTASVPNIKNLTRGYDKIFEDQYFTGGKYYSYMGDNTQYDYQNYQNCHKFYETGYKFEDVIDYHGQFYVIHPDELLFNRNLNGEIIEILKTGIDLIVESNTFNKIKSRKIESFMDNLLKRMMLAYRGDNAVKTEIGKHIRAIHENLQQSGVYDDIYDTLLLIYSTVFNNTDDMIRYICMKSAIKNDLKKLFIFSEKNRRFTKDEVRSLLPGDHTSDVVSLIELTKITDDILNQLTIPITFNDVRFINQVDDDQEIVDLLRMILATDEETNKSELKKSMRYILENENENENENNNNKKDVRIGKKATDIFTIYTDNVIRQISDILHADFNFKDRIKGLGINSDAIIQYYGNYNKLLKQIILLRIDDSNRDIVTLNELGEKLKPIKSITHKDDPVTHCLLLSKPYNIVKYITNTSNRYIDVFNPDICSVKSCASLVKSRFIPSTLMTDENIKSYMYYDSYNLLTNDISICHQIRPDTLGVLSHIITMFEIKARYNKNMDKKPEDYEWDDEKAILNYGRTFNEICGDLSKYKNYVMWSVLPQIDSALTEYAATMEQYEKYGRVE